MDLLETELNNLEKKIAKIEEESPKNTENKDPDPNLELLKATRNRINKALYEYRKTSRPADQ